MRTRKLTCPLPVRRMQLQSEYFEKSVKKSVPKWLRRMQQWGENNSRKEIHNPDLNIANIDTSNYSANNSIQTTNIEKREPQMDTLMVPRRA